METFPLYCYSAHMLQLYRSVFYPVRLLLCFRKRKSAQSPDEVPPSEPGERESLLAEVSHNQKHNSGDPLNSHYSKDCAVNS